MTSWPLIRFAMISCVAVCSFVSFRASAQYAYLDGDPRLVHAKLISDLQLGNVDHRNFTDKMNNNLLHISNADNTVPSVQKFGRVKSICATLVVNSKDAKSLAFRSYHENGILDWVVLVFREPQRIDAISFLPSSGGGAPSVLPTYFPNDAQTLRPPTNFDCVDPSTPPSADGRAAGCKRWPAMCD